MRPESRQAMSCFGKVVWLKAEPESILARMAGDATTAARRPSLTERGPLEEIIELLKQREPIYQVAADIQIDTESKTPNVIADEILMSLDFPADSGGSR